MNDIIAGDPAPTNPTDRLRTEVLAALGPAFDGTADPTARAEELLARYEAMYWRKVLAEVLGTEQNPSPLLLNATAYCLLVERIEATMTDPDQWDGDDAEVEILSRYVEWLAAGSPMEDGWPVRVEAGESRG